MMAKKKTTLKKMTDAVKKSIRPVGKALGLTGGKKKGTAKKNTAKKGGAKKSTARKR
jgi:hypothetical protein